MYFPSNSTLLTLDDFGRWPKFGRIGYCASGEELAGAHILIIPDAGDLFGAYGYIEGPVKHPYDLDVIAEPETILEILRENPVSWCPPELDDLVERRTINLRRTYMRHALLRGDVAWMAKYWRPGGPTETQRLLANAWPEDTDSTHRQ